MWVSWQVSGNIAIGTVHVRSECMCNRDIQSVAQERTRIFLDVRIIATSVGENKRAEDAFAVLNLA